MMVTGGQTLAQAPAQCEVVGVSATHRYTVRPVLSARCPFDTSTDAPAVPARLIAVVDWWFWAVGLLVPQAAVKAVMASSGRVMRAPRIACCVITMIHLFRVVMVGAGMKAGPVRGME